MELLFTKGIKGIINNSNIMLSSGNRVIETNYSYVAQDVIKLEEEYNIKLLGELSTEDGLIKRDTDFNFIISKDSSLLDISSLFYELDSKFVSLYDLIREKIFPNVDEYYSKIGDTPIFIATEGLEPNFFFKKQEFQKSLVESELWKLIDNETQNKLIYMHDLSSMIGDMKNYVFNLHYNFVEAEKELYRLSCGLDQEFNIDRKNKEQYEYKYSGYHSQIISSMYMNVIIELSSCLDIIAKFFCEITNFPITYEKPIRFKSGSIYFSNIKRFQGKLKNYRGYTNSIVESCNNYEDLILSRHLIVHNSFFSSSPTVFHGLGTHVVNYKKINYALMYIWDVDSEGKPERWLNRCKFYGQNRVIDDYIVTYLIKFYEQLGNTLELIKCYLSS
ncbi:hypothetical protein [Clostridium tagluense]|uniref:hypothetical protein n=1 Tax=Clostridium tagluense TaxID=360422 RepID=UPI001C0DF260|nr:hypothetical protein [Clostridium tagluense]MBU3130283.1 hypothetical protein [Clostridium tagluense]